MYGEDQWGNGYFFQDLDGKLRVRPSADDTSSVALLDVVEHLEEREIELPVLLRFNQLIQSQVNSIYGAFGKAISEYGYSNGYQLAFPIKTNQQKQVVETILDSTPDDLGILLEAGSKPELMEILALQSEDASTFLCNGYKDEHYIELAAMSKMLGKRPIVVIEQYHELELVLEANRRLNVELEIGFRAKLHSSGVGRWGTSSGEYSKFGLTMSELLKLHSRLERENLTHLLCLLHFHIGSQVSSILALKKALKEAARLYAELKQVTPSLSMLDVGGGLGIDYEGAKTDSPNSMDYSAEQYARDVVWTVGSICESAGVEAPRILSESGRACVAHHAVLIVKSTRRSNQNLKGELPEFSGSEHQTVRALASVVKDSTESNSIESLQDAVDLREEILSLFVAGDLGIKDRALCEDLFRSLIARFSDYWKHSTSLSGEIRSLVDVFSRDTYFCNFSVFQSLPDSWAIRQLFPVMPIHRLNEEPKRHGVIADISCDSDGKIDSFFVEGKRTSALPLHELREGSNYYLGVFLVGAYQETLGSLHNLFGDTNAVHIDICEQDTFRLSDIVEGDTVREVLSSVHLETRDLDRSLKQSVEKAISDGTLEASKSSGLLQKFRQSLEGYTYLVR